MYCVFQYDLLAGFGDQLKAHAYEAAKGAGSVLYDLGVAAVATHARRSFPTAEVRNERRLEL